jgi:uncharacterized protein with PQ loop repeat
MNNIILFFFDIIIILAPIFGYFPQIIKVMKRKTDLGFNNYKVSFLYCSTFTEMLLNFAFNKLEYITYASQLDFLNHNARLISLGVAWIGDILKLIVKTKYSHNIIEQKKHNKFNSFYSILSLGLFLPLIIILNNKNVVTILSILSSILNLSSFFPQMYETYKLKGSRSLSYISIIFDYIGNIGIISYLAIGNQLYIYTIIPLIITHICILIQLCLMIYFDYNKEIKRFLCRRQYSDENVEDSIEMINLV